MPPDRRTLRDIRYAYRAMKQYQWNAGQWAAWFRYDRADSTSHPVYDTGPQRVWYDPVIIPIVIGEYMRSNQNFDDDGLYLVDTLHIVMSYDAFFHSLIVDPDPTGADHLNDRVGFDGRLFSVNSFIPRGRVASHFLTISVQCSEVAAEDLDEDVAESMFAPYVVTS